MVFVGRLKGCATPTNWNRKGRCRRRNSRLGQHNEEAGQRELVLTQERRRAFPEGRLRGQHFFAPAWGCDGAPGGP